MNNKANLPFWIFLCLLWGQFFLALYPTWADGTYYDYGFLVPPLLVFFFSIRWKELQTQVPAGEATLEPFRPSIPFLLLAGFGIAIITVLRLIETVDSGWRLPLFVHGFVVLSVSAALLSSSIGLPRLAHLLPVALLALFAIPLPSPVEFSLIHSLTDSVSGTAVFANRWMGYPVVASGETLLVNGIPLHVSEGCSGIRSFQGSLFAGFVAGEFFRLRIAHRIVLIASGLFLAFLANTIRVVFLVRHAALEGDSDLQSVHDRSGYVSLTTALLFLVLLAWRFSSSTSRRATKRMA